MKKLTMSAVDVPDFMKKERVRKPIIIMVDFEAIFISIDSFFEKHYNKIFVATIIYLYAHVLAKLIK